MKGTRNIVVTGGTGSLGSAVARAFLDGGDVVFSVARSASSTTTVDAKNFHRISCDLSDEKGVVELFDRFRRDHTIPYAVVHTAGGFLGTSSVDSTSMEAWRRMIELNLHPSFLVLRESIRIMKLAGEGRILLVTSLSALEGGKGAPAYKVSKDAVHSLVRLASADLDGTGITVNAVAPSIFDTPQNRADMPNADTSRWIPPARFASLVVQLCNADSGLVSGSVLRIS